MNDAMHAASKSKDRRKQVGAVIIGPDNEPRSKGYNGPPRGFDDEAEDIHHQPLKDEIWEHAERNAIYNAALVGISTKNCKMYVTFPPCANCARAIVQCGIKEVIILQSKDALSETSRWFFTNSVAIERILKPCGITVRFWSGPNRITNFRCD